MQSKKIADANKPRVAKAAMDLIEDAVQQWEDAKIGERQMYNMIRMVVLRYRGLAVPPLLPENHAS